MLMPGIVSIIVTLVVIGLVLYLINMIPMDNTIKQIIHAIIVVLVVMWLLQSFGLMGPVRNLFHSGPPVQ